MSAKILAAALFLSIAAAVAGFAVNRYWLIAVGAAAALLALGAYFYIENIKKKKHHEEKKRLEINQKIRQVNFPVFMNNVKQKYGEIIYKYRLPPQPLMLEGYQYWCCDDYLVILPEWNYYQDLIYQKYKDSYFFESDEKKLFDEMFVVNKRDILYFEKSREHSYTVYHRNSRYERSTPAYSSKKTCISYRKNGLTAEKVLPEAAYDILMQLIPDKAKNIDAIFPGK